MDENRFEALAGAYGADLRRWPEAERAAAEAFRAAAPDAARTILARADLLDAALDAWRTPAPSAALREAVLARAPVPRSAARRFGFWLSGAGVAAAAAAAGIVVGVTASNTAVSNLQTDTTVVEALGEEAGLSLAGFSISERASGARDA
jgi:hypothetical protein